MAKRILATACGLLLCLALVGMAIGAAAKASLLDETGAQKAIARAGYVAERTEEIQNILAGIWNGAGLDGEKAAAVVDQAAVENAVNNSLRDLLDKGNGLVEYNGMFAAAREEAVAGLQAGGATVTEEGLEQVEVLAALSEGVFAEMTIAPMAGAIKSLTGLLGAGGGVAAIILCAALALLAVFGIAWTNRSEKAMGLYLSSALLGAGLALTVPALVLDSRAASLGGVMRLYYAPFYGLLLTVGIVLALAGLVLLVTRLVLNRGGAGRRGGRVYRARPKD